MVRRLRTVNRRLRAEDRLENLVSQILAYGDSTESQGSRAGAKR